MLSNLVTRPSRLRAPTMTASESTGGKRGSKKQVSTLFMMLTKWNREEAPREEGKASSRRGELACKYRKAHEDFQRIQHSAP